MKQDLNSCIEIESDRVSRRVTIPRRVKFKLTPEVIEGVLHLKASKGNLKLSSRQITNLRYYALLNSCLQDESRYQHCQPLELVFSSNMPTGDRFSATAIRSTINSSGKISQEIQQDLWQDSYLRSPAIEVHYWLIKEILRQIPLSKRDRASVLILFCWLPIAIAFSVLLWFCLPLFWLFKAIFTIVAIVLSKMFLNYLIINRFKLWILKQLSNGVFSLNNRRRKIGFDLLSFISQ